METWRRWAKMTYDIEIEWSIGMESNAIVSHINVPQGMTKLSIWMDVWFGRTNHGKRGAIITQSVIKKEIGLTHY